MLAKRSAMRSPTPMGGRNSPMPTAAVSTMLKCTGWMPISLASGNTTGTRTTAAGSPSSTMPNMITMRLTATRKSHGVPCRGPSSSPRLRGREHPEEEPQHDDDGDHQRHERGLSGLHEPRPGRAHVLGPAQPVRLDEDHRH